MTALRVVAGVIPPLTVYGLLLFLPAWTVDWWRGWVLLAIVFAAMIATRLWAFADNNGLLEERRKPPIQPGQPFADKVLVVAFLIVMPAFIIFIPIDVFRLHLIERPAAIVSSLGLMLFVAGLWCVALAFRENAFAAAIVKYQEERLQTVIETGPYGVVRHPLYTGVVLVLIGMPLWLQSSAATLLAVVPIALVVIRIVVEERFLKRELVGYDAYTKRVRHRLIPFAW